LLAYSATLDLDLDVVVVLVGGLGEDLVELLGGLVGDVDLAEEVDGDLAVGADRGDVGVELLDAGGADCEFVRGCDAVLGGGDVELAGGAEEALGPSAWMSLWRALVQPVRARTRRAIRVAVVRMGSPGLLLL